MLPIVLPLADIVVAGVDDAPVPMPLVVAELTFIQAVGRDLLADSLCDAIRVQLSDDLRDLLALAHLQIEGHPVKRYLGHLCLLALRPVVDELGDFGQGESTKLGPLLPQVLRDLVARARLLLRHGLHQVCQLNLVLLRTLGDLRQAKMILLEAASIISEDVQRVARSSKPVGLGRRLNR